MRTLFFVLGTTALMPTMSQAQIPLISEIFSHVSDVNTSFGFGRVVKEKQIGGHSLRVINFEVTLAVGSWGCRDLTAEAKSAKQCAKAKAKADSTVELRARCELSGGSSPSRSRCAEQREEDEWEPDQRKVTVVSGSTTTTTSFKHQDAKRVATAPVVDLEVGLSYGQVRGFRSTESSITLTGWLEEVPVVATYANFSLGRGLTPYLGMRAGLTKFSALRAYRSDDVVSTASASSYLIGGGLGIALDIRGKLSCYVEGDYADRGFPSIEWSADPTGKVASILPRRIDVKTLELNFGVQLGLK